MKKISGVDRKHIFKNFFRRINEPYDLRVLNAVDGEELLHVKLTKKYVYIFLSMFLVSTFLLLSMLFLYTPIKYYIPGYETVDSRKKVVVLRHKLDSLQNYQQQSHKLFLSTLAVLDSTALPRDTHALGGYDIQNAEMSNVEVIKSRNKSARAARKEIDTTQQ